MCVCVCVSLRVCRINRGWMEKHNFILALAESGHKNIGFRCAELPSAFADSRVRESARDNENVALSSIVFNSRRASSPDRVNKSDVHRGLRIRPLESSAATRPESSLAMTSSGHDGGGPGMAGCCRRVSQRRTARGFAFRSRPERFRRIIKGLAPERQGCRRSSKTRENTGALRVNPLPALRHSPLNPESLPSVMPSSAANR